MEIYRRTIEDEDKGEFLRQISTEIDFSKDDYKMYIDELEKFCKKQVLYALAPVQIGIPKRMIYLRNTTEDMNKNKDSNYNEGKVLINPEVVRREGKTLFLERCDSCCDLVGEVYRPYLVEVNYYDINGDRHNEIFEGFAATVFSHEMDHLDGVLHFDIAKKTYKMDWEETRRFREENPYKIISKK